MALFYCVIFGFNLFVVIILQKHRYKTNTSKPNFTTELKFEEHPSKQKNLLALKMENITVYQLCSETALSTRRGSVLDC